MRISVRERCALLAAAAVVALAVTAALPPIAAAATVDGTWSTSGPPASTLSVVAGTDASNNGFLLAGTATGGIYRSADGATWTAGALSPTASAPVTSIVVRPGSAIAYAAVGHVIYRTVDGSGWQQVGDTVATTTISGLLLDAQSSTTVFLYAAAQDGSLYRFSDSGGGFSALGATTPSPAAGALWAVAEDVPVGSTTPTLYAAADSGVYAVGDPTGASPSWTLIAQPVAQPTPPVARSLVVDPSTSPQHTLWIGSDDGHVGTARIPVATTPANVTDMALPSPQAAGDIVTLTLSGSTMYAAYGNFGGPASDGAVYRISTSAPSGWDTFSMNGRTDDRSYRLATVGSTVVAASPAGAYTFAAGAPTSPPTSPPTLSAISPQSATVCSAPCSVTLTLTGTNFAVGGTNVLVGDAGGSLLASVPATVTSDTTATATLPSAALATARTLEIGVQTSVLPAAGPLPFYVTGAATSVTSAATGSGTDPTATTSDGSLTATGTGTGTVSVATYSANPVTTPAPTGVTSYVDLNVGPGGALTSVTLVDCTVSATNTAHVVYYWDGSSWVPVTNQTYDPTSGCVTMTFDPSSLPSIGTLSGTVFANAAVATRSLTIGPSNTEGTFTVSPGDWLSGGYRLKLAGKNQTPIMVSLAAGTVTLPVTCGNGTPSSLVVRLPAATLSVPAGSTAWLPTASGASPRGYQGAGRAVDVCSGTRMRVQAGATLRTQVWTWPATVAVSASLHYHDANAKTKHNVNCSDPAMNPEPGISDCAADWSSSATG